MPSRHDALAGFYADKADELHRAIRRAISGPDALVEDACAHAWCQLVAHDHVTLDSSGFRWLYVVALRAAYGLSDEARREPAAAHLTATARSGIDVDAIMEVYDRLALLGALPARRRQMVFLHASGFSYAEIARITGATLRTVERQLLRGRRTLRRRSGERVA